MRTRRWLWILSAICVLVLLAFLVLFVFRITNVSVVPQSQTVTFDPTSQFTAYPATSAPVGTIPYMIVSVDIDGSTTAPSSGTQQVDTKASGTITVVNAYSTTPVQMIKNTRFETSSGLIFRAPAAISVPGKHGSTPGTVDITVIADAPGSQYNVGPQGHLSVPGLRSSTAEYAAVYAISNASTTGGFSGTEPSVSETDLTSARAQVRADLQGKIDAFTNSQGAGTTTVLASKVAFVDEPNIPVSGSTVSVNESAHIDVALVPADVFASTVGQTVAADVTVGSLRIVPGAGFGVTINSSSAQWGSDPLSFTLTGHADLVWVVDTKALAQALAGRSQDAFQTIVSSFPGVQSAHARIEPFWENSFPSDPTDIHVSVTAPSASQ